MFRLLALAYAQGHVMPDAVCMCVCLYVFKLTKNIGHVCMCVKLSSVAWDVISSSLMPEYFLETGAVLNPKPAESCIPTHSKQHSCRSHQISR